MARRGILVAVLCGWALVTLAGCGGGASSVRATVTMSATGFAQNSLHINAGDPVTFTDPATGGGHFVLYYGNVGRYIANIDGPKPLNSTQGVTFSPGDSKTFTFDHRGTYEVTCAQATKLNVIITVR